MNVSVLEQNLTINIPTGPIAMQNEDHAIFRVNKQLITEKSGYFRKICWSNPQLYGFTVRWNAKIFKIAIDVINGSDLATTVKNLDNLIYLHTTTVEFEMYELKVACLQLMAKSVNFQTVWKIYDTNHAPVIENCEWLLKTRTKDLLKHPDFVDIKPETLARFLRLEEMNIESETVLFEATLRFSRAGRHGSYKDVFRQYALPHLRVKTLTRDDHYPLRFLLTLEEFLYLRSAKTQDFYWPRLCLDTRPRRSEDSRVLVIEPDKDIYDSADFVWYGPYDLFWAQKNKFVLSFVTKRRIMLQRIFFFCPLLLYRPPTDQFHIGVELQEPGGISIPIAMVMSLLKIFSLWYGEYVLEIKPSNMFLNKIAFMNLNVVVPESACVSVEIEFNDLYYYHRIAKSEAAIFESSDPCVQEVLGNVTLRHFRNGQETNEELIPTIFKSVHTNII